MTGAEVKRLVTTELRERLTYFKHYGYDSTEVEAALAALASCVVLTREEAEKRDELVRSAVAHALDGQKAKAQRLRDAALLTPADEGEAGE